MLRTKNDFARMLDAAAKRVRKGWRWVEHYRATWRNWHPVLNR